MENWFEVVSTILGMTVVVGSMFKFMWNRIDKRFEDILKELRDIKIEIKEIKVSITSIESRVARLETQDEERFRNEIKLLITDRRVNQG